jgi:hypothetical protein
MEEERYKELKGAIIWANDVIERNYEKGIIDLLMELDTDGQFYNDWDKVETLKEVLG